MRELTELIDQQSSGWLMVQQWLKEANNNYEVLNRHGFNRHLRVI